MVKKHFGKIPVIDLFAGPGGLGEGFSSVTENDKQRVFNIALSVENNPIACKTLLKEIFQVLPQRQNSSRILCLYKRLNFKRRIICSLS